MSYGDDLTSEQVLQRDIQWQSFLSARLISDRELQLITRFDKASPSIQASLLEESGPSYIEAFFTVLRNVTKEDVVQYVLAVLDDLVTVDPSKAKLFHQQSELHLASLPDPYTIFLRLLSRQDWFTQQSACRLLTAVIESRPDKHLGLSDSTNEFAVSSAAHDSVDTAVQGFVDWLTSQLTRPSNPTASVRVAVTALAMLLKERAIRLIVLKANGPALLTPLLRVPASSPEAVQLMYQTCMCMWQLTYLEEGVEAMQGTAAVTCLVDVCRTAHKEKVLRVAYATIKNLMERGGVPVMGEMVERGLPKVTAIKMLTTFEDPDVGELLEWVDEELKKNMEILSSFDKYKKEVLSGTLDWSPMHTSVGFWKANHDKFEERDYMVLRVLLKLLETARDTKTLAVGCHDLGMFITHHATGRFIVTELAGKSLVMKLMMHEDVEVQKQALLCVQKLMLAKDKADYLSGSTG